MSAEMAGGGAGSSGKARNGTRAVHATAGWLAVMPLALWGAAVSCAAAQGAAPSAPGLAPSDVRSAVPAAPAAAGAHAELVAKGQYLTQAGDCMACHTAETTNGKAGQPFAGGRMINTPFGAMSSPNITPDVKTGIGAWTDDQFYRAMHEGIGRHGEYLYPVMPFPWYSSVSRDDVLAIKAYLFTQPAVQAARVPNRLAFPFNIRTSLLAWREVFFEPKTFQPDPTQTDEVNRGAYLANGLAHCGECHNAQPVAGTSKWRRSLQGGVIDNWYAPNITSDARDGIGSWSNDQLATFLKTGVAPGKGIAVGPMMETVHSLSHLTDADLHAIAAYLKTTPPQPDAKADQKLALFNGPDARGAQTYLNHCASCHGVNGQGVAGAIPALAGNGAVASKGPQNVIRVIVGGREATHQYGPMPAVGAGMSDQEVADAANYVRQSWRNAAPPTAMPGMVAQLRKETDTLMNAASGHGCPPVAQAAVAKAIADPRNGVAKQLAEIDEATMWQAAAQLGTTVARAAPKASHAEVVNGLTAAYCAVVHDDAKLAPNAKALQLGQFSQLVYMAVSDSSSAATRSAKRQARVADANKLKASSGSRLP
ncbi:hypothetical protein BH11PSE9_BH11PSE9_28760 [soil metagenome]